MTRTLVIALLASAVAGCRQAPGLAPNASAPSVDVLSVLLALPMECEVHHLQLERVVAPAVYGLIDPGVHRALAESKQFPHIGAVWFGGCIPGRSHWAIVRQCERCREGELAWERERAAAGRPFVFDAARRARVWALYEGFEAPPTLDAASAPR
jgi:hypothetical protein